MNGALALGVQTPRIVSIPPYQSSAGQEAIDLCAQIGLVLDPWQQFIMHHSLGERDNGRWAAFEVGIVVSRQNGKDSVFEARELAGLFLFGEKLLLHSTHEFKTTLEHFRRVLFWLENVDTLRRRVRRIRTSHGEECVELLTGQRLRFVARTTGSGRGFSGDCVILNEAFNLPEVAVDALMPTLSARPNPQLWYGSSPGDKDIAPCEQLARVRRRGIKGDDPSLAYFEWSIEPHTPECGEGCTEHDDPADPASWAKANPALGIRISQEHVAREHASMGAKGFLRERLGVGNWPTDAADQWAVIPEPRWRAVADEQSEPVGRVAFAIHVSPDRSWAAIATAGRRADGLTHVEVVDHRPGTGWVPERAKTLVERWDPCALVVDAGSPAGSLIAPLEELGLEVVKPTAREVGHAFGQLIDGVMPEEGEPTIRVLPHPALDAAVAAAVTRPLGDARAWDSKAASADISPLVAATLAAWGFATRGHVEEDAPPNLW
ncbi:terminase large subunit [Thermoactinospora rubra]|uniref:terminase large subunit n=1 Tax=Thermoactinospora rubra TaxID=1088767 RepID=UPI000A0FED6B|nr:terminase large subunit [Thermoactinospora rubra]